jgi:uncharacterized protein YlxW (UPF0749 family)
MIRPGTTRPSVAGAVIGLLVGLLAFALVVQVRSNTADTQLANARQDDLVRILSDLSEREQRLRTEIGTLESTLDQLGSGAEGRAAALAQAARRADELGILAGTLPAEGQGLVVTIEGPVRAVTILAAVQELRGAGAEALMIAGADNPPVRVVASTFFADTAGGIVVDAYALTPPYTISAIGPAATMDTALTIPGGVVDSVARDGGTVITDESALVRVDAVRPAEPLRYAQPVD